MFTSRTSRDDLSKAAVRTSLVIASRRGPFHSDAEQLPHIPGSQLPSEAKKLGSKNTADGADNRREQHAHAGSGRPPSRARVVAGLRASAAGTAHLASGLQMAKAKAAMGVGNADTGGRAAVEEGAVESGFGEDAQSETARSYSSPSFADSEEWEEYQRELDENREISGMFRAGIASSDDLESAGVTRAVSRMAQTREELEEAVSEYMSRPRNSSPNREFISKAAELMHEQRDFSYRVDVDAVASAGAGRKQRRSSATLSLSKGHGRLKPLRTPVPVTAEARAAVSQGSGLQTLDRELQRGRSRASSPGRPGSSIVPSGVPAEYHIQEHTPIVPPIAGSSLLSAGAYEVKFSADDKTWTRTVFPSLVPATREEVVALKKMYEESLGKAGTEEQRLEALKVVMMEIVRQSSVECLDRGVLLQNVHCEFLDLLRDTPSRLLETRSQLAAERTDKKRLQQVLDEETSQRRDLQRKLTDMQLRVDELDRERDRLGKEMKLAERSILRTQNELRFARTDLEKSDKWRRLQEDINKELVAQVHKYQARVVSLRSDKEKLLIRVQEMERSLGEMQRQLLVTMSMALGAGDSSPRTASASQPEEGRGASAQLMEAAAVSGDGKSALSQTPQFDASTVPSVPSTAELWQSNRAILLNEISRLLSGSSAPDKDVVHRYQGKSVTVGGGAPSAAGRSAGHSDMTAEGIEVSRDDEELSPRVSLFDGPDPSPVAQSLLGPETGAAMSHASVPAKSPLGILRKGGADSSASSNSRTIGALEGSGRPKGPSQGHGHGHGHAATKSVSFENRVAGVVGSAAADGDANGDDDDDDAGGERRSVDDGEDDEDEALDPSKWLARRSTVEELARKTSSEMTFESVWSDVQKMKKERTGSDSSNIGDEDWRSILRVDKPAIPDATQLKAELETGDSLSERGYRDRMPARRSDADAIAGETENLDESAVIDTSDGEVGEPSSSEASDHSLRSDGSSLQSISVPVPSLPRHFVPPVRIPGAENSSRTSDEPGESVAMPPSQVPASSSRSPVGSVPRTAMSPKTLTSQSTSSSPVLASPAMKSKPDNMEDGDDDEESSLRDDEERLKALLKKSMQATARELAAERNAVLSDASRNWRVPSTMTGTGPRAGDGASHHDYTDGKDLQAITMGTAVIVPPSASGGSKRNHASRKVKPQDSGSESGADKDDESMEEDETAAADSDDARLSSERDKSTSSAEFSSAESESSMHSGSDSKKKGKKKSRAGGQAQAKIAAAGTSGESGPDAARLKKGKHRHGDAGKELQRPSKSKQSKGGRRKSKALDEPADAADASKPSQMVLDADTLQKLEYIWMRMTTIEQAIHGMVDHEMRLMSERGSAAATSHHLRMTQTRKRLSADDRSSDTRLVRERETAISAMTLVEFLDRSQKQLELLFSDVEHLRSCFMIKEQAMMERLQELNARIFELQMRSQIGSGHGAGLMSASSVAGGSSALHADAMLDLSSSISAVPQLGASSQHNRMSSSQTSVVAGILSSIDWVRQRESSRFLRLVCATSSEVVLQPLRPLVWLLKMIRNILLDRSRTASKSLCVPFPDYILLFLGKMYGLRKMIEQTAMEIYIGSLVFSKSHPEVELFRRFLEEEYNVDQLSFYLQCRSLVMEPAETEALPGSGGLDASSSVGEDLLLPKYLSIARCAAVVHRFFTHRPLESRQQLIRRMEWMAESFMEGKTWILKIERHRVLFLLVSEYRKDQLRMAHHLVFVFRTMSSDSSGSLSLQAAVSCAQAVFPSVSSGMVRGWLVQHIEETTSASVSRRPGRLATRDGSMDSQDNLTVDLPSFIVCMMGHFLACLEIEADALDADDPSVQPSKDPDNGASNKFVYTRRFQEPGLARGSHDSQVAQGKNLQDVVENDAVRSLVHRHWMAFQGHVKQIIPRTLSLIQNQSELSALPHVFDSMCQRLESLIDDGHGRKALLAYRQLLTFAFALQLQVETTVPVDYDITEHELLSYEEMLFERDSSYINCS